jgi:hypothetical protein
LAISNNIIFLRKFNFSLSSCAENVSVITNRFPVCTADTVGRHFEGLQLSLCDVSCSISHFSFSHATSSIQATDFAGGWALTQRVSVSIDSLCLSESLAGTAASPQNQNIGGGGTEVVALSKAAEGLQQSALRCNIHWVSPVHVLSRVTNFAEMRAWVNVAPLALCLRGRAVIFLNRVSQFLKTAVLPSQATSTSLLPLQANLSSSAPFQSFFQLVSVSPLQITASFLPEVGMSDVFVEDTYLFASFPLLAIDHLTFRLRDVTALHALDLTAVAQQLTRAYVMQLQHQEGVRQIFINIPAAIMPRATAVLRWLTAVALTACSAVGGSPSDTSEMRSLVAATGQRMGSFFASDVPAAASRALFGMRFLQPIASTLAAHVSAGGRAVISTFTSESTFSFVPGAATGRNSFGLESGDGSETDWHVVTSEP